MALLPFRGTTFKITLAGTPTAVGQVLSFTPPQPERPEIETTNLDTTGAKSYRPSNLAESGEAAVTFQYDPNDTTHQIFSTRIGTSAVDVFGIYWSDGMTTPAHLTFSGFVKQFAIQDVEGEEDGNVTAEVTIQVSGLPTFTPGVA